MINKLFFDEKSNVTVVVTSCNRFPLLAATLSSFEAYNTYPIKKIIIVEDSGNTDIYNYIPENWKNNCEVIVNSPQLGQIKSIDLAYNKVETEYIFHCEDDWVFYRKNFIEESLKILESDNSILQVWLRSFDKDIKKHYSFHSLGQSHEIKGVHFHNLESSHNIWQGFSFNPGLRRLKDYKSIAPFSAIGHEAEIAIRYNQLKFHAVILANSAIEHLGWEQHILTESELNNLKKRNISKKLKHIGIGILLGITISTSLFYILNSIIII